MTAFEAAPLIKSPAPRGVSDITGHTLSSIDTNYGDTNRASTPNLEFDYLMTKIVLDAVNLLNHRLREYFHFDTDLNSGYWPSGDEVAGIGYGSLAGNYLTESPISATRRNATALVLYIQNAVFPGSVKAGQTDKYLNRLQFDIIYSF